MFDAIKNAIGRNGKELKELKLTMARNKKDYFRKFILIGTLFGIILTLGSFQVSESVSLIVNKGTKDISIDAPRWSHGEWFDGEHKVIITKHDVVIVVEGTEISSKQTLGVWRTAKLKDNLGNKVFIMFLGSNVSYQFIKQGEAITVTIFMGLTPVKQRIMTKFKEGHDVEYIKPEPKKEYI